MAYEESLRSITMNADSSLAAYTGVPGTPGSASPNGGNQYRFVKVTGAHQVGLANATDTTVIGVLQNKPQNAGNAATIGIRGVSKVVSNVAITAGDRIQVAANGKAAKTGSGPVVGVALSTTANADELVSVLLLQL